MDWALLAHCSWLSLWRYDVYRVLVHDSTTEGQEYLLLLALALGLSRGRVTARSGRRLVLLVEHVRKAALAAILAVEVARHENTRAALRVRAHAPQAGDLAVAIDLVVLEHGQLHLLVLVLDLLRLGVLLLLALLAATAQAQHQVQRRLLLDVVVRQSATVLELLAREDQTLLVRRDTLLVLDLGLDVLDGVAALHLERDGLARQCLDEDLHAAAQAQHQ